MIKLRRVVTDKGFILEEINSDKINKELIDDGSIKPVELPHVENNPESVQDHIDAIKEIVDKEKEEMEKKALETKSEDRAIFAESKLFKDRSEMSSFIVKLKEQKIKHRVLPLHEDKEGYKFELRYEKPLNEQLTESYETAFEVCEDGSKISAVGSFKHTKNYTHELVDFDCASGSGSGDYRWMNRPWQRFTFAEALREAMINAGVDEACAKECIENSFSLKSAVKYFAEHCCKKEESKPEECLKEEVQEVQEEAYKIADHILNAIKDRDTITRDEFEEQIALACRELYGIDNVWETMDHEKGLATINGKQFDMNDLDVDIRGILSYNGWATDFKDGDLTTKEVEEESLKEDREPKLETFEEKIDFLVKDEDEAIAGYDKILAMLDAEKDANAIEQLTHLKEEEIAHKDFLEVLKKDPEAIYSHEDEEEPKEEPLDDDDFDNFGLDDEEIVDVEEDEFDWEPALGESLEEEKKENMWDFDEEDA